MSEESISLYRKATIGMCLEATLNELKERGGIDDELADRIFVHFDKAIKEAFKKVKTRATLQGKLHTFRGCDNVWMFLVQGARISRTDGSTVQLDYVKIVAAAASAAAAAAAANTKS